MLYMMKQRIWYGMGAPIDLNIPASEYGAPSGEVIMPVDRTWQKFTEKIQFSRCILGCWWNATGILGINLYDCLYSGLFQCSECWFISVAFGVYSKKRFDQILYALLFVQPILSSIIAVNPDVNYHVRGPVNVHVLSSNNVTIKYLW